MPYLCYKLKITYKYDSEIYRVIEIDGNQTFADLSDAILDAFEFDHSHLYMFSQSRKAYDSNGIYHPMADGKIMADEVRLRDAKPVVRNKYLYLYDFGDDWMFYITVIGIRETDQATPVTMIQSQGELCQYPDWDDEDDGFSEDWDECAEDFDDLVITVVEESDEVIENRLMEVPALLQRMWIMLVEKELHLAGDEEISLLRRLEDAGLVDVDETDAHLYLKVKCGKKNWDEYGIPHHLQRRCAIENTLLSLAGIYGVIELDMFYGIVCDYSDLPPCSEAEFDGVVERLSRYKFWTVMEMGDGKAYISAFGNEIAEEILRKREKYPVKCYCTFGDSVQEIMATVGWKAAFPVYQRIYSHLFFERMWYPEIVEELLEQLVECVAVGMTEQEYFGWLHGLFKENEIHLTKQMERLLREFRNEFPSAALKGYTWGEYEKHRKDGYHQLTLFEEDLPFK